MITASQARKNVDIHPQKLKDTTLAFLYKFIEQESLDGRSDITVFIDAICFNEVYKDLKEKGFVLSSDKVWDLEYTISWD